MLQTIRERAQGWIAWVIVILITIPFALWGIQEYMGIGGEAVAAKVNGANISERELDAGFQRFRTQLREQLGASYKAGLIDDKLLKGQVLNSMVRSELLIQTARDQNMQASDAMVQQAIASIPAFQKAGKFDYPSYEQGLRLQGLTPDLFFQRMRGNLVVEQLSQSIKETEFSTRSEVETYVRLKNQKRDLSYLLFPVEAGISADKVEEAAVKAYYEDHKDAYMTPERVKLEYIELSVEDLAKEVKPDDKTLAAYLEGHADDFRLPEELHARHILVMVKDGKGEEAREKAAKLLARLKGGEDFAQIAKTESQDPGSAEKGGDLGFFGAGVMEPSFEKATAALQPGETSELVETPFGFHIIQLMEKRGGGKADLSAVRDRVVAAHAKEEAQRIFYEKAERLTDLAYETPTSLEPIIKGLGLTPKLSDWISRDGGEGSLKSPKVTAAAFSEEVLTQGNNSEAIELGQEHILVLRVVDHESPAPKPLEAVSKEMPAPISLEMRRVVQEIQLGISLEVALDNLLRRVASADLKLMVTAMNIQREVGGNLAEILDTISFTIRERIRIKGEIRVLTAQQRITGYMIGMVPFVLALFLYFVNRTYIMQFFNPATRICGIPMVVTGLLMIFLGFFAVQKIASIEV